MKKVCIIIGYGEGLGASLARLFGSEGYTVALSARSADKLSLAVAELGTLGVEAHAFPCDAGDSVALAKIVNQITSELGGVEVLIYNAAALTPGKPTQLTAEGLSRDFAINVIGASVAANAVLPLMKAVGHGTILFTGGMLALQPWANYSSLSIGKAGIRSLALTLGQELKGSPIRIGTITVGGFIKPGTAFDPATIAETFLAFHQSPEPPSQTEIVFKPN